MEKVGTIQVGQKRILTLFGFTAVNFSLVLLR